MSDRKSQFHFVDGRWIFEAVDENTGTTCHYEIVAAFSYFDYAFSDLYREAILAMAAVGADIPGIDDLDDLYQIDAYDTLWGIYLATKDTLPEGYAIWKSLDCWMLLRKLDNFPR